MIDKVYDPKQVEQKWYRFWMEKGYFTAESKSREAAFLHRDTAAQRDGRSAHGPCPQ